MKRKKAMVLKNSLALVFLLHSFFRSRVSAFFDATNPRQTIVIDTDEYFPKIDWDELKERAEKEAEREQANPEETFTFDDLKKRILADVETRFRGSAWFGGTSPFHKFHSDCYYALGSRRSNSCIFDGTAKPSNCTRKPFDDLCGESLLPGCWHGSARATKNGKVSSSLTCYPMARNSYMSGMLPRIKEVRSEITTFVMTHVLKTVEDAFNDFNKTNAAFLKKGNVEPIGISAKKILALLKSPDGIRNIIYPKDAFWNVFTDPKIQADIDEPKTSERPLVQGSVNLCSYFSHAAASNTFPNGGSSVDDAIERCRANTKEIPVPPLCLQSFEPIGTYDRAAKEAYDNWMKLSEFIRDKEEWKIDASVSTKDATAEDLYYPLLDDGLTALT